MSANEIALLDLAGVPTWAVYSERKLIGIIGGTEVSMKENENGFVLRRVYDLGQDFGPPVEYATWGDVVKASNSPLWMIDNTPQIVLATTKTTGEDLGYWRVTVAGKFLTCIYKDDNEEKFLIDLPTKEKKEFPTWDEVTKYVRENYGK